MRPHAIATAPKQYSKEVAPIPYELLSIEKLDRPIFVMAFKGLFDTGEAATGAIDWLSMVHESKPGAVIDPETLFDFQQTRPRVRVGVNGAREIVWPSNNIVWAKTEPGERDLVLLAGVEPNLRWRSFGESIRELIEATGTELVVTLGAILGTVPHTRSLPVTASTGDAELATRLGIGRPTYEGPTGLVGSLHDNLGGAGIPCISLRVTVPHYVPGAPSPKATAALLAHLERICGIHTEHAGLAHDIRDWESLVHQALVTDDEVRAYVESLENDADDEPTMLFDDESDVAAEIEGFLRMREEEG